jgi:hypothetical protein
LIKYTFSIIFYLDTCAPLIFIHNHTGKERKVVYKNCGYFGLERERIPLTENNESAVRDFLEESKFVVSNEWQEKALGTGVNFCHKAFADFHFVVELVNDFIQKAKVDANAVPEVAHAYPMLHLLGRVHGHFDYLEIDGLTGGTAEAAAANRNESTVVVSQARESVVEIESSSVIPDIDDVNSMCDGDCNSAYQVALVQSILSDSSSCANAH